MTSKKTARSKPQRQSPNTTNQHKHKQPRASPKTQHHKKKTASATTPSKGPTDDHKKSTTKKLRPPSQSSSCASFSSLILVPFLTSYGT